MRHAYTARRAARRGVDQPALEKLLYLGSPQTYVKATELWWSQAVHFEWSLHFSRKLKYLSSPPCLGAWSGGPRGRSPLVRRGGPYGYKVRLGQVRIAIYFLIYLLVWVRLGQVRPKMFANFWDFLLFLIIWQHFGPYLTKPNPKLISKSKNIYIIAILT